LFGLPSPGEALGSEYVGHASDTLIDPRNPALRWKIEHRTNGCRSFVQLADLQVGGALINARQCFVV